MTATPRVLICGGGIAGLTLAYWLRRSGHDATVIERAPTLRHDGYAIDFLGMGFDVAERMGITPTLAAKQVPVDALVYVSRTGRPIASLPIDRIRVMLGGRYMALMHHTLENVLFETVQRDVEIRFGTTITALESTGASVDVTLDDGSRRSCDVLVGADGIHSGVRTLALAPENACLRPLGYVIASYRVPDRYELGQTWTMYLEPGRLVGLYTGDVPGSAFAFFMFQAGDRSPVSRPERMTRLRRAFDGVGWIAQDLLDNAPEGDDVFMDIVAQVELPRWHVGRVAFVGDACDCPTLVSGQGASLAMGGAFILAQCLREEERSPEAAFERYERQLRPYVESQQKAARAFARSFIPSTKLGIALQHVMLRILFRPAFAWLLRRQFDVRSVLDVRGSDW